MKKPSIREVAELAGVSTATVSHVLNGTRFVTEETIQKVMSAVKELQYTPNTIARGFRTGKSKTIGFILPDISNHFFSSLVEIIENYLSAHNYHLIIAITREDIKSELEHLQYFASGSTDGIILASAANDCSIMKNILPDSFPITFIDRHPDNLYNDSVIINSEHAILGAINYLINKGHRRIGFLSGLPALSTTVERLQAYKSALKQNNIDFDSSMISFGNSRIDSTKIGTDSLISNGCTAIVVCNGLMTYEAQQYLWESNNDHSQQIEIVGFKDEYRLAAGSAFISQPIEELGTIAAKQILNRINNPDAPVREIILSSRFVT